MKRQFQNGMTLVELLVVVMIIAILASIAVPSYRNYVIRANRTDAKATIMATAAALERCYSMQRSYAKTSACTVENSFQSNDGKYQITIPTRDTTFLIQATPIGGQLKDTACASFRLDQTNVRTVTGTKSATPQECWAK